VAVLPEYRGRGLARQLVTACVDFAKKRGATAVALDVVAGNTPAYTLYEKLGFVCYSGQTELNYQSDVPLPDPALPVGYILEKISMFDWRPRYELAQRIIPEAVKQYAPVEEGRYRQPSLLRPLMPLIRLATRTRTQSFVVRANDTVVAVAGYGVRTHQGGVNGMNISLDPDHAVFAPALVNYMLYTIQQVSPGHRISLMIPHYQEAVIRAALDSGFTKVLDHQAMALLLPGR
jgi:hypothetical protein